MALKPVRSLKARALQWLAQREQSRTELRRKLLPHARLEFSAQEAADRATEAGIGTGIEIGFGATDPAPPASFASPAPPTELSPEARVETVLDWLEAHQYLSQARFAESRIHARAPRFGNLRIRQELKQHQVALSSDAAQALQDSELARACAVRGRKFSTSPTNMTERARQGRFLIGRGFSSDVVRQALREAGLVAAADADAD